MRRILAMLFIAVACVSPAPETSSPARPTTSSDLALYLTASQNGAGLIAVDPLTLEDRSAKPLLSISPTGTNNSFTVASPDGGAIAVMNYNYRDPAATGDLDITVFDAVTGAPRARLHPEVPVIVDSLSPDGSRLYARRWPARESTAERLVLDSTNGKILEREPEFRVVGETIVLTTDEHARRQYRIVAPTDPDTTGPQPVDLCGWDLRTGKELWRLGLPSLLAGEWKTGRIIDGIAVRSRLVPAIALSPDRRQIAVVGASAPNTRGGTIWLIDTNTGTLISQKTYSLASSFFERLLAPSIAMAKSLDESVIANAGFSADGRLLYVYGHSSQLDSKDEPRHLYSGMMALTLSDATVRGHDIKWEAYWFDNRIEWIRPSPDGKWLYLFLERRGSAYPKGHYLRRVDGATLRVLAERPFDGFRQPFLLATR